MGMAGSCPLCQQRLPSLTQLRRHIGKHLEELALFALPSHVADDQSESDDYESTESRSLLSNRSIGQSPEPNLDRGDNNRDGFLILDENPPTRSSKEPTSEPSDEPSSATSPDAGDADTSAKLYFNDGFGRKFHFPWHLVKTWEGMDKLIKDMFIGAELIGPHVGEGKYILFDDRDRRIQQTEWKQMVHPGSSVTMRLRDIDAWSRLPPPSPPPPPGPWSRPQWSKMVRFKRELPYSPFPEL